jgi:hypothetical protein
MKVYRTAPQKERKAAAEFRQAGVRAYVPLEQREHKGRKGARIKRRVPAVPGYVFAGERPEPKRVMAAVGRSDTEQGIKLIERTDTTTSVGACIGTVNKRDLAPLYAGKRLAKPAAPTTRPWRRNDRVLVSLATGDKTGTIVTVRKGSVGVDLDGARRTMQVSVKKLTLLNKVE